MFELDGVRLEIGGRAILRGLDLGLGASGVTGLIGHNGSGKSTLLRIMSRQLAPSAGTVRFEGRPLPQWRARELARRLAFLPQEPPAAAGLRVRDLVALGRYPWHGALGRFGASDRRAVEAAMERTFVRPWADRAVTELSGGERQCCWIAMCVAQGARCLLLDEPTAALDLPHQRTVLELLRSLASEGGVAAVVVLHDVNLAARFCDELLALRGGEPVARGTPAAVMQPDVLRDVYGMPLGLLPHPAGHAPIAFLP